MFQKGNFLPYVFFSQSPPAGKIADNKVHPYDVKTEKDKKKKSLILVGVAVSLLIIIGGIISAVMFAIDGQTQSKGIAMVLFYE